MRINQLHAWPTTEKEAIQIQYRLKSKIVVNHSPNHIGLVAGVDTAFDHLTKTLFSAVCLYSFPELKRVGSATASARAAFPYRPGLLAFREGPVILQALGCLAETPDVVLFAAHGIAHPRRFGAAGHIGLILNIPTVGCARKLLAGRYQEIGPDRGEYAPLYLDDEEVGIVLRSRSGVKPVFISPGHLCSIKDAFGIVSQCLGTWRIPEPLRSAHILANRKKRGGDGRKKV